MASNSKVAFGYPFLNSKVKLSNYWRDQLQLQDRRTGGQFVRAGYTGVINYCQNGTTAAALSKRLAHGYVDVSGRARVATPRKQVNEKNQYSLTIMRARILARRI